MAGLGAGGASRGHPAGGSLTALPRNGIARPPGDGCRRHFPSREVPFLPTTSSLPRRHFCCWRVPPRFTCAAARVLRAGAAAVGEHGAAEGAQPPPQGLGQRHAAARRCCGDGARRRGGEAAAGFAVSARGGGPLPARGEESCASAPVSVL